MLVFRSVSICFCGLSCGFAFIVRATARPRWIEPVPSITLSLSTPLNHEEIRKRQILSTTCGFANGDPSKPRTANSGFECRVDTQHGLWGFCPTTVIAATDCGFAGNCVDTNKCSDGCGITGASEITTFTCTDDTFCSTALLTVGIDQTYSYIACGPTAITDHLRVTPTSSSMLSTTDGPASNQLPLSSSAGISASSSTAVPSSTLVGPTSPAEASERSSSTNNTGSIIGGVIGGIALLCICAIAIVYLLRRERSSQGPKPWAYFLGRRNNDFRASKSDATKTPLQAGWGPAELHGNQYGIDVPAELPAGDNFQPKPR